MALSFISEAACDALARDLEQSRLVLGGAIHFCSLPSPSRNACTPSCALLGKGGTMQALPCCVLRAVVAPTHVTDTYRFCLPVLPSIAEWSLIGSLAILWQGSTVDIYLGVSRPMRKRLFYILSIGLGVAGFCAVPFIVGMPDVLWTIGHLGWFGIVLFVANASCTLIIPAIGWWLLMRAEGIPATLNTAMLANLMGFPLDFMVPSAYLGGEPLKMIYIAHVCHVPPQRVLATIIVAKFQEFGGLILGMIVTTAYFIWHTGAFATRYAALLIIVMVILVCLLGIIL